MSSVNIYDVRLTCFEKKLLPSQVLQECADQSLIRVTELDLLERYIQTVEAHERQASGQIFQDLFALSIIGDAFPHTFLEFGATDGRTLSNSYFLESGLGWSGTLCEPSPQWHQELHSNRPNTTIVTDCVWSSSGETLDFFISQVGELSTLAAFKESDANPFTGNTAERTANGYTVPVQTISLNDVIEHHCGGVAPSYMSVDTEGSEFEILNAFDFARYRPRVLTVEHNFTPAEHQLDALLLANGYKRVLRNFTAFDAWYVDKETLAAIRQG